MMRFRRSTSGAVVLTASLFCAAASAQAPAPYDYHRPADQIVDRGMQALMICNGLFVSHRPLDLIYDQELKLNLMPVLPPREVAIDEERRAVRVGGASNDAIPPMRAAYREGFGCVAMAPDQTFDDIDSLPVLPRAPSASLDDVAWPDGDRVSSGGHSDAIDVAALEAASEWAFEREAHGGHSSQITLSLLIVHDGEIVHERYADGVDRTTRTRTWSTAKSIASTLVGIRVGEGELSLDEPLPFDDWRPHSDAADPRRTITLRHALHMSSGLYTVDNERCAVVGSCLSYWAGASSVAGALDRGLVRAPGTHWDYENYDTLLAVYALRKTFDAAAEYHAFPQAALFNRIGMHSTVPGVDRFGDFVMSSQVYTNARDLARLGLLHLERGRWNGEQVLPDGWVDFVRRPAPSTVGRGGMYGGQWWLVPDERDDVPPDAYSTAGNRGQYAVVVPSYDVVVVRRGLDYLPGRHGFSQWDLVREVLEAFPERSWGAKGAAPTAGGL